MLPGSPADIAKLQSGKLISRVDNTPVSSPAEFYKAIATAIDSVALTIIQTDGVQQEVVVLKELVRTIMMKYAICNETFENWTHDRICGFVREAGYLGLEMAPFTLADRITNVSTAMRAKLKKEAEAEGIKIIGLHWLLAKTEGFCLTSPDLQIRSATADYLVELAKACQELGGTILVLGSPAQRRIPAGFTKGQATGFAVDTLKERSMA